MTPERWKRLRAVIEVALETASPEQREVVLSEACAGDSTLLSEARSMLRAAAHTGGFWRLILWRSDLHRAVRASPPRD